MEPIPPDCVQVFVEIPQGSRNKYEYDPSSGLIRLDRVLYASVHYPAEYGFIPGTRGGDGDPLDALVLAYEPTFPGCLVPARPVGVLVMRDDKGQDEKVLAVPAGDPRFEGIRDLADLAPHWPHEIRNFFATYKTLEGRMSEVEGWRDAAFARALIERLRVGGMWPLQALGSPGGDPA
jgi:inorganic pyrophosphatase